MSEEVRTLSTHPPDHWGQPAGSPGATRRITGGNPVVSRADHNGSPRPTPPGGTRDRFPFPALRAPRAAARSLRRGPERRAPGADPQTRRTSRTASSRTPVGRPHPRPPVERWSSRSSTSTRRNAPREPRGTGPGAPHHARRPRPSRRPTGLRLTWMGHSTVLAEIDGRRVLFDPVWGERCSPFAFAGPKRLHPAPAPAGRARPGRRGRDLARPLRPPRPADHPGAGRHATPSSPCRSASAPTWSAGACRPSRLRELDWHESTEVGRPHPDRHPGPALLRPRPAQHAAHPVGLLGRHRRRPPDLPQRRHRLLPRLRRHRRASTARSTPR